MRLIAALTTLLLAFSTGVNAQENAYDTFAVTDNESTQTIDYAPINRFLSTYSREERKRTAIYYDAMQGAGEEFLTSVLTFFESVDPRSLNRNEQLAYWLNLRNLLVIQDFAGNGPKSIASERGSPTDPGSSWTKKRITLAGVSISIHDIETKILNQHWENPDIIYGLYQGSQGGAPLPREMFQGPSTKKQLRTLGQTYVNTNKILRIRKNSVTAPAIYSWYKADYFNDDDTIVQAHLAALTIKSDAKKDISEAKSVKYSDFNYRSDASEPRRVSSPRQSNRSLPSSGAGTRGGGVGS